MNGRENTPCFESEYYFLLARAVGLMRLPLAAEEEERINECKRIGCIVKTADSLSAMNIIHAESDSKQTTSSAEGQPKRRIDKTIDGSTVYVLAGCQNLHPSNNYTAAEIVCTHATAST